MGVRASVRFGAVPNTSVRFDTGVGGSIRYSVKVLLKRPCLLLQGAIPEEIGSLQKLKILDSRMGLSPKGPST